MDRITSGSNRLVREVRELQKKRKARKEAGLFIAEGERLCREIPTEAIERIFITDTYQGALPEGGNDARLFRVPEKLMQEMSDTRTSQGILCEVRMRPEQTLTGDFFLLLEDLQDPGNLGTIFRTAEAAGVSGIYMSRECVDIYSPKVVRSTMGALYRMPFCVVPDLRETARSLRQQGVRVYAAHLKGTKKHYEYDYRLPTAFMIGNEGNGLTEALAAEADGFLRIPMKGQVESLNAAIAATVLMFEAARQREQ